MRKGVGLRQHGDSGLGQHLIADERCIADHFANIVFLFVGKIYYFVNIPLRLESLINGCPPCGNGKKWRALPPQTSLLIH